jgi:hypothetical protein
MNTIFPPLNKEEERKRAFAKIYALLIKLADEVKHDAIPSDINSKDEQVLETTDVPLQQNIPPSVL